MFLLRRVFNFFPLLLLLIVSNSVSADSVGDCLAIEFTSSDCVHCKEMHRSTDHAVRDGWVVRRFDAQRDAHIASRWQITNVPTTILVRNGREVDRILGPVNYSELSRRLIAASSADSLRGSNRSNISNERSNTPRSEESPFVRGQSPVVGVPMAGALALSEMPAMSLSGQHSSIASHMDPCLATVRIRVEDSNNESVGTGTIIDSYRGESLVLTCGHLFRESYGKSSVTVETFLGGQVQKYAATLIDFQAREVDIGLLSFRPSQEIAPVKLIPITKKLTEGQKVFSVGCDRGAPPSRIDSRISKLNRYLGSPNVEVTGQPVEGRSGGGLFDENGQLIGVCYAADPSLKEGLYNAAEVVYQQLAKLGLQRLFNEDASSRGTAIAKSNPSDSFPPNDKISSPSTHEADLSTNRPSEMTVILKDATGRQELLLIPKPSPVLLQAVRDSTAR